MKVFTLEKMLKLPGLRGAKLLTGETELRREVRLANVMEVPDISNWATEKSVILTTAYPFRNDPRTIARIIQEFHEKDITALGIKLDRYIKELPSEVLDKARELNFPVILLPLDTHFDKMILEILTNIIDEDYIAVKAAGQLSRRMRQIALEEGTLMEVAELLAEWCGGDVTIRNASDRRLAKFVSSESDQSIESISYNRKILFEGSHIATITLQIDEETLEEIDLSFIDEAIPSIIMILFRTSLQYHTKKRDEWLHELILGHEIYSQREKETMKTLGVDLEAAYVIGVLGFNCAESSDGRPISDETKAVIDEALYGLEVWPISTTLENNLIHLIRHVEGRPLCFYLNYYSDLLEKISPVLPKVCVGIGGIPNGDLRISEGYREAVEAIEFGIHWREKEKIFSYDQLRSEILLEQIALNSEFQALTDKLTEPLRQLEGREKGKLLPTLEALLSEEIEKTAAQKLFIHPKTLTYRKTSIESALGISLKDPLTRFNLLLALYILKFRGDDL